MVAKPDEVIDHVPSVCAGCERDLHDAPVTGMVARQVFELPPVRVHVSEHRSQQRRCSCGHLTSAVFPDGVSAPAVYGPRVRALGVYLTAYQHLPYGRAAQLLGDWLGVPVSTGTLVSFVARAAEDLQPFLDEIHAQLCAAPVAHFDETGARVDGRLRWLFVASTQKATFYSLHDRRGLDGLQHAGVLQHFAGTAVHDGWAPYRRYTTPQHALCNAHHLRELLGVIEQQPDGERSWATRMDQLLRELHLTVQQAKASGQDALDPLILAGYRAAYEQIITLGHRQHPPDTNRTGQRGRIRQAPARNLLLRLDEYRQQVLRFAHDFGVPFDNNQAERDIRMIKIQQKISGCWRTTHGANRFLAIRAYLSTAAKNHEPITHALTALAARDPWLPTT